MLTPETTIHPLARQFAGRRAATVAIALVSAALFVACSKPAEKTEDIRPVRTITLASSNIDVSAELSGEVRPKIESRLGFRVPGKIVSRKVETGTVVKRGQVLMQLDPQDLALAQMQAKAGLTAAESNRDLARAELKRYQELRAKNFVAAAVLDSKEVAAKAAQSSYEQALAGYKNQSNQSAYTSLVADIDGVVTGIDAEVGQVVAAGTPVVRVAQSGAMDVVVGIPEDKVNSIRQMSDVSVRLWASPGQSIPGKLRELSPIADTVTRTYTAKISLPADVKDVQLGMTAYVNFNAKNPNSAIKVPLTALFQEKNASSVWVVESGVVRLVPVQVAGSSGEEALLAGGVKPGQVVVTAGANLLKNGQKVTILGVEAAPAAPAKSVAANEAASGAGAAK
ncbi:efflux RND transporter periplasmic adaptor subunit [Undibacterium sp. TS12]|uniref:efflux RND transporter periplasmic adaptor subunit n=1 Tax=Undibacterium sp. TS12 TaxID=2908202 RepID=UPI001F4C9675|nr:efflux RND transporter periplasmic adaptor subunit [Undibacterium sp. TS12]